MEETRMVDFILERRCFFNLKKEMTKKDFDELCRIIDLNCDGSDVMFLMDDDPTREPDDYDDSVDCVWEEFENYPIVNKEEVSE